MGADNITAWKHGNKFRIDNIELKIRLQETTELRNLFCYGVVG
jgi:hypothetical protein